MVLTIGQVTYSHDLLLAALQSSTLSYKVVLERGSIQIFCRRSIRLDFFLPPVPGLTFVYESMGRFG